MTALFERLQARAERAVAVEALRRIDALAADAREFKGVDVEAGSTRLTLSGRGLMRRWLGDAALRFWIMR
jgi:hypothetical protein